MRARIGEFSAVSPTDRQSTIAQTQKALREGFDQIIALGGDGTINAVVNGFFENGKAINPKATLFVSSFGTGSDYHRMIMDGSRQDWIEVLNKGEVRTVDVGQIEYLEQDRAPVFFANLASLGMSAEVVVAKNCAAEGGWWTPAFLRYAIPALRRLFFYRSFSAQISTEDAMVAGKWLVLFIAKGKFAGGGMRIGGRVGLGDGKFDITLVKAMGFWKRLQKFPLLYFGLGDNQKVFEKLKATRLEIRSSSKIPLEFDGENGGTTDVCIRVVPQMLRVGFPKGRE